jgi:hypothetical protein
MNASRVDNINVMVTLVADANLSPPRGNASIRVYATNHNIFRVVNGFGGVLFTI